MRGLTLGGIVCALLIFGCGVAYGDSVSAVTWTGTEGTQSSQDEWTLGWRFTADQALAVTHLGAYVLGMDGLQASHIVRLYALDGSVLGEVTVAAGTGSTTTDDHFRYEQLGAAVMLAAGTQYVVAAANYGLNEDWSFVDVTQGTSFNGVTYGAGRYRLNPGSTANWFPEGEALLAGQSSWEGYFGGSFLHSPVPEPTTLALFGLGAGALALRRRKRKLA